MLGKCVRAAVKAASSWVQSVTSVAWKMALGESGYCVRRAWASGRRERSAMRTLQPLERRRDAKEKFMPWGLVSMGFE